MDQVGLSGVILLTSVWPLTGPLISWDYPGWLSLQVLACCGVELLSPSQGLKLPQANLNLIF
jgi:hypothetical protein